MWTSLLTYCCYSIFLIQINQLEADLQELGSLLETAERKRVQELLKQEQKKVGKELATKRQQQEQQAKRDTEPSAASKASYTVKITSYGKELFTLTLWKCNKSLPELQKVFANCSHSYFFYSVGPVRQICQNLPEFERCAQNSIGKCGCELFRKVTWSTNKILYVYSWYKVYN